MPRFTLIAEHYDEFEGVIESTITHQFEKEYLDDVIMQLQEFLRGAGYYFDGELGIVEPVMYTTPENAAKMEASCCGAGCGDTVQHNDHYYDINRNR